MSSPPTYLTNINKILTGIPQAAAWRGREEKSSYILDHLVTFKQFISLSVITSANLSSLKAIYHAFPFKKYSILQQEQNSAKTCNRSKLTITTRTYQLAQDQESDDAVGQLSQMDKFSEAVWD